jgi:hypothetical protein
MKTEFFAALDEPPNNALRATAGLRQLTRQSIGRFGVSLRQRLHCVQSRLLVAAGN